MNAYAKGAALASLAVAAMLAAVAVSRDSINPLSVGAIAMGVLAAPILWFTNGGLTASMLLFFGAASGLLSVLPLLYLIPFGLALAAVSFDAAEKRRVAAEDTPAASDTGSA